LFWIAIPELASSKSIAAQEVFGERDAIGAKA
jgi:hypothetical protein